MTLHDDIHAECCKCCKKWRNGPCGWHYACEMYAEEYAEIEVDWLAEATLLTEQEDE